MKMDKTELNYKVSQIKKLVNKSDYATAMKIADTIDWRRVRSTSLLTMASSIYEKNLEYQDAKDILLIVSLRLHNSCFCHTSHLIRLCFCLSLDQLSFCLSSSDFCFRSLLFKNSSPLSCLDLSFCFCLRSHIRSPALSLRRFHFRFGTGHSLLQGYCMEILYPPVIRIILRKDDIRNIKLRNCKPVFFKPANDLFLQIF